MNKSRNWCFTLNNYTNEEYHSAITEEVFIKYGIVGKEVGDNGTPHLQGYYHLHSNLTWKKLKDKLPRAHWEICKGTPSSNIKYCSKENNFYEWGVKPLTQQEKGELGKRSWEEAKALAIEGKLDEIAPSIYICQYSNLKRIMFDHQKKPTGLDTLTNHWIHGLSGTGKSRMVWEKYPDAYRKMANKWWDQYNGEDVVVLEDVDLEMAKWIGFYLKIWADHYPFRAEIKGGSIMIRPKIFIVTSQYMIHQLWTDPETNDALCRRFKYINKNENEMI